jgi:DNA-binding protein
MKDEKIVFVGGKPFMNYVTAVVMQFTTIGANNVIIRSRGKFINRAVDVAEMVRSKFLTDSIEIGDVTIAAEDFKNREGRPIRVSTIDIQLNRLNGVKSTPTNFELRRPKTEVKEEVKEEHKPEETVEAPVETEASKEETPTEQPVVEESKVEETQAETAPIEEPVVKEALPAEETPTETVEETQAEVAEPEVKEEPKVEETPTEHTVEETSESTEQTSLESK